MSTGKFTLIFDDLTLTPAIATALFILAILAGYRYRRAWKSEGPVWELWLSGVIAAACFFILAFTPVVPA
ncbi:MAG: hypothetical protein AAGK67_06940 [Pseudomonadota bacterium]